MKNINCYLNPFCLILAFCLSATCLYAQIPDIKINNTPVISGLTEAMQLVHAGDGSNRMFIVERAGVVKSYRPGALGTPIVYLNMNSGGQVVGTAGEGGLLSVAFHPDFSVNGFIYTYYTDLAGDLVLARYTAANPAGDVVSASTRVEILKIPHPVNNNHNGGEMHFGYEDGYLYLSTGDGGAGGDPNKNGQNPNSLLGKILRIDINPPVGSGLNYVIPPSNPYGNEVFALGLRNPFRWSFDRATYDMWIGDVGQGDREEINHRTAGTANGANYGWRCFEGDIRTPGIPLTECPDTAGYVRPVYTYETGSDRGSSVIGGVVYRGSNWPVMQGYYIGTDYYSGDIHKINTDGSVAQYETSTITGIRDIGEDEGGEIYAVTAGQVYRIEAENPLPVTLISFNGVSNAEGVKLSWQTVVEEDFNAFEIEYSLDARRFDPIGSVPGAHAASGGSYSFTHTTSENGLLYYRLKMTDLDQRFRYSKILPIDRGGISDVFVRPSLISSNEMNLVVDEPFHTVELVSVGGQVILTEPINGRSGPVSIPLGDTGSGIYIVRMAGHDRVLQQKILVQR
jgi:glucose/arabinose dehydrogenase